MALTDQDIRLMASQVLADVPEGGGRMTGNEVVDNVSNNLFADVSELDRTIGRVSLRKAYPAVLSANRDAFYGANVIVDTLPADPNVSVTLFTTGSWTDQRSQAVSRMESYLARGPKFDGYLWDQHIAGQRAILLIQRTDRELPAVGQTLVLVKYPGQSNEVSQFVRVTKVTATEQMFSASGCSGDFLRRVVTCEIGTALDRDYKGGTPNCNDDTAVATADTRVYTTVVADAARYAGMTTLAQAAAMGALTVKAASIFTQLVPSAQVETPIVDAKPHGDAEVPIAAGGQATLTTTANFSPTASLYLGGGILPGSLTVTIGSTVLTDLAGRLMAGATEIGTVDYSSGILRIASGGPTYTGTKVATWTPAAMPVRAVQTAGWDVAIESRSQSVVFMLDPPPGPGTLAIHYMAQGRWYVLRDDGSGALRGADTSYGSGTINFSTGSVVVTLGALPDVGSTVIAVWGAQANETTLPSATLPIEQVIQLNPPSGKQLRPGSLTITWTGHDSQTKTATATGATLSGDATGEVDYANNRVTFRPNVLPPVGTALTISYGYGDAIEETASSPGRDGQGRINLTAQQAIRPGSLTVEWPAAADRSVMAQWTGTAVSQMLGIALGDPMTYAARDDGAGNLKYNGITIGSVNYGTGAVQWLPDLTITVPKPNVAPVRVGDINCTLRAG